MAVHTKIYLGLPGRTYIIDTVLINVIVLKVTRSDMVYRQIGVMPSGAQLDVLYTAASGRVDFDPNVPFTGGGRPGANNNPRTWERVTVKYKT